MGSKVLLFEEDATAAAELQAALEKLGCEVTLLTEDAFGGGWVIALAAKVAFDLILVAADPPEMNGLGVCDRIKQDPRTQSVPVILLSTDADALEAHKQQSTRADGYVRKPVDPTALAAEVNARISSLPSPQRGRLASLPAEEIDLDDALLVESNVPRQRSIPPPVPGGDAASVGKSSRPPEPAAAEAPPEPAAAEQRAESDEDKKRAGRSSRVSAREARDQRKLLRELEKEVEALKSRVHAAERERQALITRADRERSAARTDRELATKRAEEQARRIERGKGDLEQSRQQLARAVEEHAAALEARDRAHEQKVARIHVEQGQAQAAVLANALRALREDLDAKQAAREEEHRAALESQAREHAVTLATLDREGDERRAAEMASADARFEAGQQELSAKLDHETTRSRKLREELEALQGVVGDLEREKQRWVLEVDAQRTNYEAALEGASADTRDRVRALERALGDERAKAEAEWKTERVGLTSERDEQEGRARAAEEKLQALETVRVDLEHERERLVLERDAQHKRHEEALEHAAADTRERVAAVERRLGEERAAVDTELAAQRLEVAAEHERGEERLRVLQGELAAAQSAGAEVERARADLVVERDRGLDRTRSLEEELRTLGAVRVELEADKQRLVLALEAQRKEQDKALEHAAAESRERVGAIEQKLGEERAAAEAEWTARRQEIAVERERDVARARGLEEQLATAEAARVEHDKERAALTQQLEELREGHEADLAKLAKDRAAVESDAAGQRLELVAKRYEEQARARALEEELRRLEAVCADLQRGQEALQRDVATRRKDHDVLVRAAREADEGLRDAEHALAAERAVAAAAMAKADADARAQRLEILEKRDLEAARARSLEEELRAIQSARVVPELEHLAQAIAAARRDHQDAVARIAQSAAVATEALAAEKEARREDANLHAKALASAAARLERSVQEAESRSVILEAEQAQERLELREAHAQDIAKLRQAHEQALAELRRELGGAPIEPKTASLPTDRAVADDTSAVAEVTRKQVRPMQQADQARAEEPEGAPPPNSPPGQRLPLTRTERPLSTRPPPPPDDDEDTTTVEVPILGAGGLERARRVLLIARDRETRADLSRALKRTGCEVVVRDSCADVANDANEFDLIVTEVAGVGIEELLEAFARNPPDAPILVSAARVDGTRKMFQSAGLGNVSVILKASRPDALVAAVRAHLDRQTGDGASSDITIARDSRRKKGAR